MILTTFETGVQMGWVDQVSLHPKAQPVFDPFLKWARQPQSWLDVRQPAWLAQPKEEENEKELQMGEGQRIEHSVRFNGVMDEKWRRNLSICMRSL